MIPKASLKEFQREFTQRTGDSIKKLVMAKIVETPAYVITELGLEFPPGQNLLWGLLILGQQDIHFFVHATESSLATMFRNATNGRPPREQYLHIPRESLCQLEPFQREPGLLSPARLLPFLRGKPRMLKLQFLRQEKNYTLILEPVAGLEGVAPLLPNYLGGTRPDSFGADKAKPDSAGSCSSGQDAG